MRYQVTVFQYSDGCGAAGLFGDCLVVGALRAPGAVPSDLYVKTLPRRVCAADFFRLLFFSSFVFLALSLFFKFGETKLFSYKAVFG